MKPDELDDVMRCCQQLKLVHAMSDDDDEDACMEALDALQT